MIQSMAHNRLIAVTASPYKCQQLTPYPADRPNRFPKRAFLIGIPIDSVQRPLTVPRDFDES